MRALPVFLVLGLLLLSAVSATAQELPPALGAPSAGAASHEPAAAQPRIARIVITGNHRVETEAIRVQLHSRVGAPLDEATVDSDIRAIYSMGFFQNVEARLTQADGKWVLTYEVTERPLIKAVHIEGNRKLSREDLEGALKMRPNTILEPDKIENGIAAAKQLYEKKGYLDAAITYSTKPVGKNEVDLTYTIKEGAVVRIKKIIFEGNQAFSSGELKSVMQTKEKWLFSFLTGAGNLDKEVLKTDIERLTAFYYDHGYIDVKIDEPVVQRKPGGLYVTIKIDEGPQYKVHKVEIAGDLLKNMKPVRKKLSLAAGQVFRTSKLRDDINMITQAYGDQGYAFVNVSPDTAVHPADKTVDVTYKVSEGPEVYIDKIQITGNTKTRDKVIRRELELQEQQRFSGSKLRRSLVRLRRLGFFQDVNITTRKAEKKNQLDLLVDVKEASTGAFSAGAGISSGQTFLFNVRLSEINLFGTGQHLVLNADFGQIQRNFSFDYTIPYFRDTNWTTGFSVYDWQLIFDEFTRGGTGASFRFLYPFTALGWKSLDGYSLQDTRFGLEYRIENADITSVSPTAATVIQTEQGSSLTSSVTPRLYRDTRNNYFDPTDGSMQDLSVEVAGLGGESKFVKAELKARWYRPIWKSPRFGTFVFSTGGDIAYGRGYGSERELPLFERYFPGGINSVRGFRILSLGPQNEVFNNNGGLFARDPIGGSEQLIFNNEIIFPIVEALGLKGVVFFDAGNAFTVSQGYDLNLMRMSAGGGVRWMSPIGPLRIELGFPLNAQVGDNTQTVMFSFGGPS